MGKINAIEKISEIQNGFEDTEIVLKNQVKKWENVEISRENKKQVAEAEKDHREKRYALQNIEKDIKSHLNSVKKDTSTKIAKLIEIIESEEQRFKEFRLKLDAEDLAEKTRLQKIEQDRIDKINQTITDFENDSKNFINECKTSDEVSQAAINLPAYDFQELKAESIEALDRIKEYRIKVKYDLIAKEKAVKLEAENADMKAKLEKYEELEKQKKIDQDKVEEAKESENGYSEVGIEPAIILPEPSEKSIGEKISEVSKAIRGAGATAEEFSEAAISVAQSGINPFPVIKVVNGSISISYSENGIMKNLSITTIDGKVKEFFEKYISEMLEGLK
ncbi:MAG: hypothetical protein KQ78_02117 [Candidatus Izimaplasma bacterium HR2]|nr:MAG: hypothetical protein KQ78_02117 [Candidatus Izimaplasma bacterium HR2]